MYIYENMKDYISGYTMDSTVTGEWRKLKQYDMYNGISSVALWLWQCSGNNLGGTNIPVERGKT